MNENNIQEYSIFYIQDAYRNIMKTVSVYILIIATILLTFSVSLGLSFAQTFTADIDAAFLSDVDNKLYLLKGDQYVRLSFVVGEGATMDEGYPQPIADWTGLPS